jgi:uncharacterized protein
MARRLNRQNCRRLPAQAPTSLWLHLACLSLFCILALPALAVKFPVLTGRVVDEAKIIPVAVRAAIEAKSKELEAKSGIQLVVATVDSLQGVDIETFANELFRSWKLGETKNNNGVLLLVAPKERKVRIEVGYGLEGVLTDAMSNVIISSAILPRFKNNDYAGGIDRGIDGIIAVLSADPAEWQPKKRVREDEGQTLLDVLLPFIVIAVFLFVFASMTSHARGLAGRSRNRSIFIPYGGPSWGGGSSWSGGGGGSADDSFSGGGGSSGGGGASGSW